MVTVLRVIYSMVSPYFFIIAADGQELAAGAPGQSLDPQ